MIPICSQLSHQCMKNIHVLTIKSITIKKKRQKQLMIKRARKPFQIDHYIKYVSMFRISWNITSSVVSFAFAVLMIKLNKIKMNIKTMINLKSIWNKFSLSQDFLQQKNMFARIRCTKILFTYTSMLQNTWLSK